MAIIVFMQAALRVSLVALVSLIAGVSVTGCVVEEEVAPSDDPKLIALKHERMATFRPPRGRIVFKFEQTEGRSFGKPHVARITRVFAYRDLERARRGRVAAVAAAQASGWKLNLGGANESPIFGGKRIATGGITLTIGWYEDKDEGVHKVSIGLEHNPCQRGRC